MPTPEMVQLIVAFRDFACGKRKEGLLVTGAFTEQEFAEFLFVQPEGIDYWNEKGGETYPNAVFRLFQKVEKEDPLLLPGLAKRAAQLRLKRLDVAALISLADAALAAEKAGAAGAAEVAAVPAPAGQPPIPAELTSILLGLDEERPGEMDEVARDLRTKLREKSYTEYDLAGRLHLSHAEEDRLMAILALEAEPNAGYVRWLAERVIVETPVIGLLAAQALICSAVRLDRQYLDRIIRATTEATRCLDVTAETKPLPPPQYNLSTRKEQLDNARKVAELRKNKAKPILPGKDFDRFLQALRALSWKEFDELCRAYLSLRVDRMANPSEPVELAIVAVVLAVLRQSEEALIRAAATARPQEPTFTAIAAAYLVPVANG